MPRLQHRWGVATVADIVPSGSGRPSTNTDIASLVPMTVDGAASRACGSNTREARALGYRAILCAMGGSALNPVLLHADSLVLPAHGYNTDTCTG